MNIVVCWELLVHTVPLGSLNCYLPFRILFVLRFLVNYILCKFSVLIWAVASGVGQEMKSRLVIFGTTFTDPSRLWRRRDIQPLFQMRVCNVTVLYDCVTCPESVKEVQKLLVFLPLMSQKRCSSPGKTSNEQWQTRRRALGVHNHHFIEMIALHHLDMFCIWLPIVYLFVHVDDSKNQQQIITYALIHTAQAHSCMYTHLHACSKTGANASRHDRASGPLCYRSIKISRKALTTR